MLEQKIQLKSIFCDVVISLVMIPQLYNICHKQRGFPILNLIEFQLCYYSIRYIRRRYSKSVYQSQYQFQNKQKSHVYLACILWNFCQFLNVYKQIWFQRHYIFSQQLNKDFNIYAYQIVLQKSKLLYRFNEYFLVHISQELC